MPTLQTIVLAAAALTTTLIAGLFYGYLCSVNPGLNRLPDLMYLSAMQSINRAILNPVFFLSFVGALVLLPLSAWLQYSQPMPVRVWLLLGASVLYVTGVFGVTVFGNVPLNEALDAVDLETASVPELATHRTAFEGPWNKLHTIRTLASILTSMLVIAACLSPATDR
ncbi:anthrone oxygenase family protein [Spirosoma koreense]